MGGFRLKTDMKHEFWNERWHQRHIGFHLGHPHDWLVAAHERIPAASRIYVPLCGKTVDLVWLRDQGHDVIGCEFVASAIQDFFREHELSAQTEHRASGGNSYECHRTPGLSVLQGDALNLNPELAGGPIDVIFDRAALVALDPTSRQRYVDGQHSLLRPGGHILLIAFAYDQSRIAGPLGPSTPPPSRASSANASPSKPSPYGPKRETPASRPRESQKWKNAAAG